MKYVCPLCEDMLDPATEDHSVTDSRGRIWHFSCAQSALGNFKRRASSDSSGPGEDGGKSQ